MYYGVQYDGHLKLFKMTEHHYSREIQQSPQNTLLFTTITQTQLSGQDGLNSRLLRHSKSPVYEI